VLEKFMSREPLVRLEWTEQDENSESIGDLVNRLAAEDGRADEEGVWPETVWRLLADAGATRWSLPEQYGGAPCSRRVFVQRYAQLAGASLTAVFILSQHAAAVRRLLAVAERETAAHWLNAVGQGRAFVTVGVSQLTTSRRLGSHPLMAAMIAPSRYRLDGTMPWVTAAVRADLFVTGALMDGGRQILVALPANRPGVAVRPPFPLAALQASCTSEVVLEGVEIESADLLAGPATDLSLQPGAVGTASLETSALALGQAKPALDAIIKLALERSELTEPVEVLCETWRTLCQELMALARDEPDVHAASHLRTRANALVLRATQAYLTARKGTGFLRIEPAQRWARQALFFLVWSCPAPVAQAAIRDLAGLCPP
jgi:alkylation response protein AidB-like acyl-CoA dehydrogenase